MKGGRTHRNKLNLIRPAGYARSIKLPSCLHGDPAGLQKPDARAIGWEFRKCLRWNSLPKGWRLGEFLVETLLAEQPVGRHLAFALDVGGPAVFDVVSADLRQSIPRRLAQMNTPRRTGRLHPRGGVHRVAE